MTWVDRLHTVSQHLLFWPCAALLVLLGFAGGFQAMFAVFLVWGLAAFIILVVFMALRWLLYGG